MCGIFGYCGKELPENECLETALDTLTHRGPDQRGSYCDPEPEYKLWLGHRRLSILDLSEDGRQPFVTPDRKVAVAVNGEIYNVSELRPELEQKGAVFQSKSDSEILLWGFYFEGENFFRKMRGMFAAAIWDRRAAQPRLILLRDRMGIKPMHYRIHGSDMTFASELKAITALPDFSEEMDPFAMDHHLVFRYIPAPLTIYKNTFKVRPGEYVVFEQGKIRRELWWKISSPKEKFKGSFQDAVDELDLLLNESVREHLAADVTLGAFLSGGIDSSLICAIAQKQLGSKSLKTFTIGFETEKENESKYAAEIAEYLGTDHHCRTMRTGDMLKILPKLPAIYDEPYSDCSALPTYLLCKFARKKATVALSGDGGDELFFGYNNIKPLQKIAAIDSMVPRLIRIPAMRLLYFLQRNKRAGLAGKALSYDRFDEAYLLISGVFHRLYFDRLTGHRFKIKDSIFRTVYKDLKRQVPAEFLAPYFDQALYLPDDILCKVDRASMACSLEVRPPLLDYRIVEFANSLPAAFKYGDAGGKIILKEVLKKYIPETLWNRPKQGFSPPVSEWFRNDLKKELDELFSAQKIKEKGRFKASFIQERLKDHLNGKKDNSLFLWTLLCGEKWEQELYCQK